MKEGLSPQELAQISRKKDIIPVSGRFHLYLQNYEREASFSLGYKDLMGWTDQVAVEDKQGRNTYWDSLIYPAARRGEIEENLKAMYCLLKMDGDMSALNHLFVDRIDFCNFANSYPFRIRVVNQYNDNHDYFYVKNADANRIYGLELEHLLSPNNINFLVNGSTLVEEHIAGIPGDTFINDYMVQRPVNKVRVAKEFVKFNERCFVRLLGDMRSYNYVMDVTLDFDEEQYRVRAIDFDQQSYEGDIKIYWPQFHKENIPVVELVTSLLTVDSMRQYQVEERALMAKRAKSSWSRLNDLLDTMEHDQLAPMEKVRELGAGLAKYHKNDDFRSCTSMGDLTRRNILELLKLEL